MLCLYCQKKELSKTQKKFCSQSCHFHHLNKTRPKWTPKITPDIHEMIEGVMFSDGHLELAKTANYPRLTVTQMATKKEYLDYIEGQFGLSDRVKQKLKKSKKYNKTYDSYSFDTKTSPVLSDYYKRWYPEGKKIIPKDFKITPISLMHLYIGDGTLATEGGYQRVAIYTYSFTWSDLETIVVPQFLQIGIKADIRMREKKLPYPKLTFGNKKNMKAFKEYLPPNPVRCFDYKFDFV